MSMPKPLELDTQSTLAEVAAEMILLGPCGGAVGLVGFVAFGIVYEEFVIQPMRVSGSSISPYSQVVALLAIPAGMFGAWTTVAALRRCYETTLPSHLLLCGPEKPTKIKGG